MLWIHLATGYNKNYCEVIIKFSIKYELRKIQENLIKKIRF